jgi:outer membrane protein TolC
MLSLPLREKIEAQDIKMKTPEFPDIEQAWDNAQKLRPEITFFEDQIRSSVLNEKAKAVENFPTIFAGVGYSYTQNKYQVHEANSYFELGAKLNFYDGGAAKAELLKEQARQKQLQEEKDKLVEDIKFEIEDSYLGLKNACEKTLVAKDAVTQAEENVRFNRVKYNAGNGTSTDVLEAITLETRARTNYHSSDYELKRNYAKLMYSMGIDLTLIYERMENENGYGKQ